MINRNNLANKLQSVQNRLTALSDELSWVPDVLEETPQATQISWMLTVQHSLELTWRDVFGDCVRDGESTSCKDWQEAGTVDIALKFSAMHIALLTSIATLDSSSVRMSSLLQSRINVLGVRYAPLLQSSYHAYKSARLAGIEVTTRVYGRASGTPPCSRQVTLELYDVECVDPLDSSNPSVFKYTGCKDYRRSIPQSHRDDAAAACAARKSALSVQFAETRSQITTLFWSFGVPTFTCGVNNRRGTADTCLNVYLNACKDSFQSSKGKNGCEAFARGWQKQENSCDACATTARDYQCCNIDECRALCSDMYRNAASSDIDNCKEGCQMMGPGTFFGSRFVSSCCQRGR